MCGFTTVAFTPRVREFALSLSPSLGNFLCVRARGERRRRRRRRPRSSGSQYTGDGLFKEGPTQLSTSARSRACVPAITRRRTQYSRLVSPRREYTYTHTEKRIYTYTCSSIFHFYLSFFISFFLSLVCARTCV